MTLVLQVVAYIRFYFGQFHFMFSYSAIGTYYFQMKGIFSFYGHRHVFLSFDGPVEQVVLLCFSDSIVRKEIQESDGTCKYTSGTQLLSKLFEKQFSNTASTNGKYTVTKDYNVAHHESKLCFLPNCRFRISLRRN